MSLFECILNDFERKEENALLLLSKGLGSFGVLNEFIDRYARFNRLTFVVNFGRKDSHFFKSWHQNFPFEVALHDFNTEKSTKRAKTYQKGGVVFTTSQILTMDLLSGAVVADLVNNVIVFKGEEYDSNSTQFMLTLVKQKSTANSKPDRLMVVCERVDALVDRKDKVLQDLCLKRVLIWPHFRLEVVRDLEGQKRPTLTKELQVDLTDEDLKLQKFTLSLQQHISKKVASEFDYDLHQRHFANERIDDSQLRQLIDDFWGAKAFLHAICEHSVQSQMAALWKLILSANDSIYDFVSLVNDKEELSKGFEQRVFGMEACNGVTVPEELAKLSPWFGDHQNVISEKLKIKFSVSKKFRATIEAIKSVKADFEEQSSAGSHVLIMFAREPKRCDFSQTLLALYQSESLKQYLFFVKLKELLESKWMTNNCTFFKNNKAFRGLCDLLGRYLTQVLPQELLLMHPETDIDQVWVDEYAVGEQNNSMLSEAIEENGESANSSDDNDGVGKRLVDDDKTDQLQLMWSFLESAVEFVWSDHPVQLPPTDFKNNMFTFCNQSTHQLVAFPGVTITCHSFDGERSIENRTAVVCKYKPDAVIFYDFDIELERELFRIDGILQMGSLKFPEVNKPKIVFNLLVKNSIQSQQLFEAVERESQAFEKFVETMAELPDLKLNPKSSSAPLNQGIVVVDDREFGSRVPFELYVAGFHVVAQRLDSGDFLLTDEVAVERKNFKTGDFASSVKSGRLGRQLSVLTKSFNRPVLLLEHYDCADYFANVEVNALLQKHKNLTVFFSKNEIQTVLIFKKLKEKQKEPNLEKLSKNLEKKNE